MDFILHQLPPVPARVLDAGCGSGELASRLRARGYDVTAIDIDPAMAGPGVQIADICDFNLGPYDAVIFALSLHHVDSLDRAVDSAHSLLAPGGRLIVDEFAHERADSEIADRFYSSPGSLDLWWKHHRRFHTGTAMVDAISERFDITSLANVPYLHRYLGDESLRDFEAVLGIQVGARHADRLPRPPPYLPRERA